MTESIRVRSNAAAEAFVMALEELTFLPVEYVPQDAAVPIPAPFHHAKLEATTHGLSWLAIIVPEDLIRMVANTAMGVDEATIDAPTLKDVVGEMVNTACGGLVRTLSQDGTFSLGLPVVNGDPAHLDGPRVSREQFDVNGFRMDLLIGWA